jgi:amidase
VRYEHPHMTDYAATHSVAPPCCSIKQHLLDLLGSDGLLAIPSAPGPAFSNEGVEPAAFQQLRTASLSLTCIAGLGGLPQVRAKQRIIFQLHI